jgi:hypothetical protein
MGVIILDDISLIPTIATNVGYSAYSGFTSIVTGYASTYTLTLVDENGCTTTQNFNITQPDGTEKKLKYNEKNNHKQTRRIFSFDAILIYFISQFWISPPISLHPHL